MAIRLPLTVVFDNQISSQQDGHEASVAGGVANTFLIPQDTDNVVVKYTASIGGGGGSLTLQTTDDGGTTYYDIARTSIVSNANGTTAQWLSSPVIGIGVRTTVVRPSVIIPDSVIGSFGSVYGAIGNAAASSLGMLHVSGLPILSRQMRVFRMYTAATSVVVAERVTVYVNNQSATA